MVFLKEILFRAIWSFWNKNGMTFSQLWICYQGVFKLILHNKRDQEVHENFISCFLRKKKIHMDQFGGVDKQHRVVMS